MTQKSLARRSLESLEWHLVSDGLAARVRSPLGAALARAHLPFPTPSESSRLRERVLEGLVLLDRSPVHGYVSLGATDVFEPMERASLGSVLEPAEIFHCGNVLSTIGLLGSELRARKDEAPLWAEDFELAPQTPPVCERITRSVTSEGAILDTASPDLGRLRREKIGRKAAFEQTLQARVKEWSSEGLLQDDFYDQIDGRYVVPVKSGEQSKLEGALLGRSNTGQSVYIEPSELRVGNNALKELDLAVRAEELRVLRQLSDELGKAAPLFMPWIAVIAELDLALGAARLTKDWDLSAPEFPKLSEPKGVLILSEAFHPGLVFRQTDIVKNDLELPAGGNALLISGPNTGGKTVLLKAAALAACMARAGLPIPARKGSVVPHYSQVIALIGDEQNLEAGLSSFSAQIKDLREALDESSERALIVIDEILSSTDPEEASALAQAVIEALVGRGHHVLVTSHFSDLSLRCKADPRIAVGAMEFDAGRPTYRLRPGELGTSHALEVAEKLGFPATLIARARSLKSSLKLDYERAAAELKQKESDLALEHARTVAAIERESERQKRELRTELESFMTRAQTTMNDAVRALTDRLTVYTRQGGSGAGPGTPSLGAKAAARLEAAARDALTTVSEAASAVSSRFGAAPKAAAPLAAVVGAQVKIKSMKGARASVLEIKGDGSARTAILQSGNFRLERPVSDLEVFEAPRPSAQSSYRSSYVGMDAAPVARSLDVRGKRYDEALAECERYIDQAFRSGASQVIVITGHGTGALKKGLRELLAGLPYVSVYKPEREGDDGAMQVEFDR